jgi:hypothetical protein
LTYDDHYSTWSSDSKGKDFIVWNLERSRNALTQEPISSGWNQGKLRNDRGSAMYQVVLEMATRKVHVIAEFPTKEEAVAKYVQLIDENRGSPVTGRGKYNIRRKPS